MCNIGIDGVLKWLRYLVIYCGKNSIITIISDVFQLILQKSASSSPSDAAAASANQDTPVNNTNSTSEIRQRQLEGDSNSPTTDTIPRPAQGGLPVTASHNRTETRHPPLPSPMAQERGGHRPRLCFDNVTYWSLILIGILLGLLIIRRLFRYKYLLEIMGMGDGE